jgi:hypothetical protein
MRLSAFEGGSQEESGLSGREKSASSRDSPSAFCAGPVGIFFNKRQAKKQELS